MPDEKYFNCKNNHVTLEQALKDLIYKDEENRAYLRIKIDGLENNLITTPANVTPSTSYSSNGGGNITDTDVFNGYTLAQIAYILKQNGFLE